MRQKLIVTLIVITWLTSCLTTQKNHVPNLLDVVDATEQILVNDGYTSGTVFHIGDGYFITAAHVATDHKTKLTIVGHKVKLVAIDHENDIALLLCLKLKGLPKVVFSSDINIPVLSRVYTVGYHYGRQFAVSAGQVSYNDWDSIHFVHTAPANPGVSGGPIVDREFRLVGMTVMILSNVRGFQGVAIAVKSNIILEFIKEYYEPRISR